MVVSASERPIDVISIGSHRWNFRTSAYSSCTAIHKTLLGSFLKKRKKPQWKLLDLQSSHHASLHLADLAMLGFQRPGSAGEPIGRSWKEALKEGRNRWV